MILFLFYISSSGINSTSILFSSTNVTTIVSPTLAFKCEYHFPNNCISPEPVNCLAKSPSIEPVALTSAFFKNPSFELQIKM